jgi:hypothetical protein
MVFAPSLLHTFCSRTDRLISTAPALLSPFCSRSDALTVTAPASLRLMKIAPALPETSCEKSD